MEMVMETIKFSKLKRSRTNGDDEENMVEVSTNYIHKLPESMIAEILSRVPAKTVFGCMVVCKPWLAIIGNDLFAKQHFSRSHVCPLLVFDLPGRKIMHLVEGQSVCDLDPKYGKAKLIDSGMEFNNEVKQQPGGGGAVTGFIMLKLNVYLTSCEGLICIPPQKGSEDYVLICNPVTGESVELNVESKLMKYGYLFIGLGFSRVDKRFKLLRLRGNADGDLSLPWFPELLVLGGSTNTGWQSAHVPSIPQVNFFMRITQVVYVGGAIYWRSADSFICYFDFDNVVLQVVSLPEACGFVAKTTEMGVFGDTLCMSLVSPDDGHVELWILLKNGGRVESWRKILNMETNTTRLDHDYSLVDLLLVSGMYKPIKYLNCGKVLLHDWRDTFLIYDPFSQNEETLRVLEPSYLERLGIFWNMQVVPHVPSLIPLKHALNIEDESALVVKKYGM